jgi:DNA primase
MQPTSSSQREALELAVAGYETALLGAAGYLASRGLTEATARTFRLGVVDQPAPGHQRYAGMLAIPYLHHSGYPLTVRFRCMVDHEHRDFYHGKYNSLFEDTPRVFNVGTIKRAHSELHITEGEFDAMVLEQIGLNAVAIPGAALWANHHRVLMLGFSRVWVWGDDDEAGAMFVNKIQHSLRQAVGVTVRGGDVNSLYLTGGEQALLDLIS